jgi:hypothetical protein
MTNSTDQSETHTKILVGQLCAAKTFTLTTTFPPVTREFTCLLRQIIK